MLILPKLPNLGKIKSIAVLTSGGDAPGMNAAIRAVVRFGISHGCEVQGVQRGYSGLLEGEIEPMQLSSVANIIQRGGTILKTSRCPAFLKRSARREAANILRRKSIDALVVVGGDGSYTGAYYFEKETRFPTIGIPGTIDNDVYGSDDTIGFDTAVNTGIEAIDRIRDTASSHDRLFLVEVMGRASGFIAMEVGIGGGAETVVIPEHSLSIPDLCRTIERSVARGKKSSIIVVAEGQRPGLSVRLANALEKKNFSAKVCILGHTQRGGVPSAHDRTLASTLGAGAVAYLMAGKSNGALGIQKGKLSFMPFKIWIGKKKILPKELLSLAHDLAT